MDNTLLSIVARLGVAGATRIPAFKKSTVLSGKTLQKYGNE